MTQGRRPRVLILEDEWLIAEQIEAVLNAQGFDIVGPVGRIAEAMGLLAIQAVDAAVLDINVHDERSFGVAELLAARATPFVFLSGYSDLALPPAFANRPLMQKPVDPAGLALRVRSLIAAAD